MLGDVAALGHDRQPLVVPERQAPLPRPGVPARGAKRLAGERRARPAGWWRDRRGAQRALVARLGELSDPLTVIFDGRPHETDPAPGVEVAFAPHADDDIAARAAPGIRVVTSDRGLAARVRAAGGEVEPAKAFRDRLGA